MLDAEQFKSILRKTETQSVAARFLALIEHQIDSQLAYTAMTHHTTCSIPLNTLINQTIIDAFNGQPAVDLYPFKDVMIATYQQKAIR